MSFIFGKGYPGAPFSHLLNRDTAIAGAGRPKPLRRAAISAQRVSEMECNFISATQVAGPNSLFFGGRGDTPVNSVNHSVD